MSAICLRLVKIVENKKRCLLEGENETINVTCG